MVVVEEEGKRVLGPHALTSLESFTPPSGLTQGGRFGLQLAYRYL
jgi:hypothetical protein